MTIITTCTIREMDKFRSKGTLVLDVTVKSATKNARELAPEWDWVHGVKNGSVTEQEYTRLYLEKIRAAKEANPQRWENTLRNYKKIVFACYCKAGDFCHRVLLADEFYSTARQLGIEAELVPEVSSKNGSPETGVLEEPRYAGVGARSTPECVLKLMQEYAVILSQKGFILRSGAAKGADAAFETGCDSNNGQKEIFRSGDAQPWAMELVQNYLPPNYSWNRMRPYIQGLLARNMMQMLGHDGNRPVEFVVCWTKDGKDSGGTGYITRAARAHGIRVYNLKNVDEHSAFRRKILGL